MLKKLFKSISKKVVYCPYCNYIFDKAPKTSRKCPICKKKIFCVKSLENEEDIFVSEEDAKKIRKKWEEINFARNWLKKLKRWDVTDRQINSERKRIAQKGIPLEKDVIWSIFNNILIKKHSTDHQTLKQIYYEMAIFLDEEGRDFLIPLQASNKMKLLHYKLTGINKVRISSCGGCKYCEEMNGKIFSIDEALEIMPLPNKKCTFILKSERKGFCRCMYLAEI